MKDRRIYITALGSSDCLCWWSGSSGGGFTPAYHHSTHLYSQKCSCSLV